MATYAGKKASLIATFHDGKLDQGISSFDSAAFDDVIAAIADRYGKATEHTTAPVQNRMGAVFLNETLTWEIGQQRVVAHKYSRDISRSLVAVATKAAIDRMNQDLKALKKAAPDDL